MSTFCCFKPCRHLSYQSLHVCPDKRRHKPIIEDILSSLKKAEVSKSITRKVEIRYIKKDDKENNHHIIDISVLGFMLIAKRARIALL